jgi:CRP-like cAMP-binding protein
MLKSPHSSNLLLASLPAEDMAALVPHLRVIELPHKTVLFEAGDTIKALYFPHNGMVSIVVDLSSGETIEAATIGRDGLVGGSAAIDDDIALNRAIVQIEGMASVVDVGTFRTLVQQSDTLHATLARHRQFILAQAQQSAACQAAHPLTPIGRKDSWCFHAVGSSNAPLLGSTAAEGLPRIGRTSIATRWRSCGLPQSASCSENFVIPPDVLGQTLKLGDPDSCCPRHH